ncbi:MAG: hypothetical protein JW904_05315 [Spirochaetales bacterium]|nr:hypothetical protein [Spirochaetales bacterium]
MDLSGISAIVGMVAGSGMIIVMLVLAIINKSVDTKMVVLVIVGFLLIGAPSAWNSISFKIAGMEVVLEQINALKEENTSLTNEVNNLESQREDMSKQLSTLRQLMTTIRVPSSTERSISLQIDSIDKLQRNMESTSNRLTETIDSNRELLNALEEKARTLKADQ